jgi:hypothetical protein
MAMTDPTSSGAFSSALGRSDPVASADETTAALLSLNGLSYVATDTSLSVVQSRTHKRYDATRPNLDPEEMLSFTLNTGNQFMNARNSFITFELTVLNGTANESVAFGKYSSALNLFEEFAFTHSSGVEIERLRDANSWYNVKEAWTTTEERWGREAKLWAAEGTSRDGDDDSLSPGVADPQAAVTVKVLVPLYLLSDIFDQNILLPPYLVAGSRIDIELSNLNKPFIVGGTGVIDEWKIAKAQIHLDLYTVTDGVMRSITAISSTSGLDIDFTSMWDTQQNIGTQLTPTISVNKAISMAQGVHAFIRLQAAVAKAGDLVVNNSSFQSISLVELNDAQVVLGSMFLPLQGISDWREAYAHAVQYWGTWSNRHSTCTLRPESFLNDGTAPVPTGEGEKQLWSIVNKAVLTQMLERSQILASGTAISSQRNLQFSIGFKAAPTDPDDGEKLVSLYTQYAKLVSVFLDSAIVRS